MISLLLPSALLHLVSAVLCVQQGSAASVIPGDVSALVCGVLPIQPRFNFKPLFFIGLCFVVLHFVRNMVSRRPFSQKASHCSFCFKPTLLNFVYMF